MQSPRFIICIGLFLLLILFSGNVSAQLNSYPGTGSPGEHKEIENLKDKLPSEALQELKSQNQTNTANSITEDHEHPYWSHYTMENTGEVPLTNSNYGAIYEDSRGRYFAVGNNVDVWDGRKWSSLISGSELPGDAFSTSSRNIIEDRHYQIWIGTSNGLVSFNQDLSSSTNHTDNLIHPGVTVLMEQSNGNIWVGHSYNNEIGGGITVIGTDSGTVHLTDGIRGGYIGDIYERDNGDIWVSTSPDQNGDHGGISVYDGTGWTVYDQDNSGLPFNEVSEMIEDSDGNMWLGFHQGGRNIEGGVVKFDGSNWTHYTPSDGTGHKDSWSLLEASDGTIYHGTAGELTKFDGSNWSTVSNNNSKFPISGVTGIIEDQEGKLVFSTSSGVNSGNGGIHTFDGSEWDYISNKDDGGLHSNIIFGSAEDNDGNLWFSGFYGVSMFDGEDWHYFNEGSGLAYTYVWKILAASDGSVWLMSARNGITRYQNGSFTVYDLDGALDGNNSFEECAFEDSQGNIWIGAWDWKNENKPGGIVKFDGSNFTVYDETDGLIGEDVTAIGEGPGGNIYASTDAGLAVFDGSSWSEQAVDGNTGTDISELLSDSNNNLWLATGGRLIKWDGSTWTSYTQDDGYRGVTYEFKEGTDGAIWIAGFGIQAVKDGNFFTFDMGSGHPDAWSYTVLPSNDGTVYVGTYTGGIGQYAMAEPLSISNISDLPDDEGGWVTIQAEGFMLDPRRVTSDGDEAVNWTVWRKNGDNWESAGTTPVAKESSNQISVQVPSTMPTGSDSQEFKYAFKLSAHSSTGQTLEISEPDTGYALDNLAPQPVQNVVGNASENEYTISWDASPSGDLGDYRVYKLDNGSYELSNPLVTTSSTSASIDDNTDALQGSYVVVARDRHNNFSDASETIVITDIEEDSELPQEFSLKQNYPNPFNPTTQVAYSLPNTAHVTLEIFSSLGQKVGKLVDEQQSAGTYKVRFEASDLSSGTYLYRLKAGNYEEIRQMTFVK